MPRRRDVSRAKPASSKNHRGAGLRKYRSTYSAKRSEQTEPEEKTGVANSSEARITHIESADNES